MRFLALRRVRAWLQRLSRRLGNPGAGLALSIASFLIWLALPCGLFSYSIVKCLTLLCCCINTGGSRRGDDTTLNLLVDVTGHVREVTQEELNQGVETVFAWALLWKYNSGILWQTSESVWGGIGFDDAAQSTHKLVLTSQQTREATELLVQAISNKGYSLDVLQAIRQGTLPATRLMWSGWLADIPTVAVWGLCAISLHGNLQRWKAQRRRRQLLGKVCPECGYDLHDLIAPVCPECGQSAEVEQVD